MEKPTKPTLGHCSYCFERYTFTMKPKYGKNALVGVNGLQQSDFEENYQEVHILLSNSSMMTVSICRQCFDIVDDTIMQTAFANSIELDKQQLELAKLTDEQRESAKKELDLRTYVAWSKDPKEIANKRAELFTS